MGLSNMEQLAVRLAGSAPSLDDCFDAGKDSIVNGATEENCHFRFFTTLNRTKAWQRGTQYATSGRR